MPDADISMTSFGAAKQDVVDEEGSEQSLAPSRRDATGAEEVEERREEVASVPTFSGGAIDPLCVNRLLTRPSSVATRSSRAAFSRLNRSVSDSSVVTMRFLRSRLF